MRNPTTFGEAPDRIRLNNEDVIEGAPPFGDVMREIAIAIVVCLGLALAAELFTRALTLG